MPTGISAWTAASIFNAIGNATPFSIETPYLSLALGDPGALGLANPATETTRKLVSFGLATGPTLTNDAAIVWDAILGSQDPTHWALWTALSGGNFVESGVLVGAGYTAGGSYMIPVGGLVLSVPVAS